MNDNNLTVEIYNASSTTPVADPAGDLARVEVRYFETFYGLGGLYKACEIFIPRDVTANWPFQGNQRLVIRNGLTIVWEGAIAAVGYEVGAGAEQGRTLEGLGYWGWLLGARGVNKRWADNRITEDVWVTQGVSVTTHADRATEQRVEAIRVVPKAVAWSSGSGYFIDYTMPTGQTIKRVVLNYSFGEPAQDWTWRLRDPVGAANIWAISATGTGSRDDTLGTPRQSLRLGLVANANQTPAADGSYHGEISDVMVYSETGAINGQEIAKDVRGLVSELNSDEARIGALTLTLEPFITNGYEMLADVLARAVTVGDGSFNAWAVYLGASELAATPNGEPVLVLEQQPALTDYDYAVRVDEANVAPPLKLVRDFAGIYNWIVVRYRDELNNRDVVITPDDDANLKDTTSIAAWGQREYVLNAGQVTSTVATNLARRFLAAKKDPKFYVSGPLQVVGYIRAKNGNPVPAANIQAGKRVKIEDYLTDEVGVSGAGLTFLISHTRYDDASETCQISCGIPDDLAVLIAQLAAFPERTVV